MSGYIGTQPVPQATQARQVFTATASQTTFATVGYTAGFVDVYLNGVKLINGTDYTATNGSDVVLTSGAATGDTLEVVSYSTYEVNSQNYTGDFSVDVDTLYVDSTNNSVGIGTTSPSAQLTVSNSAGASIDLDDSNAATDSKTRRIYSSNHELYFSRRNDDGSLKANDMVIDSNGNLLFGQTSSSVAGYGNTVEGVSLNKIGSIHASTSGYNPSTFNRNTSDGGVIVFHRQGSGVGSIAVTSSSTSYNTSSDYRLKEDWQPMTGASDRVMALNPVNFAWKADGTRVDGFLAHELQEVIPEAATGVKDGMREEEYEVTPAVYDEEGNLVSEAVMGTREVPDYQGIDQSKIVPLLTAALQEALTKINDLEVRVATLEAN